MGFRVTSGTGATLDGIIDLGSVTQFNHTFTLSLGSIGTFMTSNFGSDWYTRIDPATGKTSVQWAVVAGDFQGGTDQLWSTRNPAVRSTPWPRGFDTAQSIPASDIDQVGTNYSGSTIAAGTTSAITQSASGGSSWAAFEPAPPNGSGSNGISFQYFNPTNEGSTNTVLAFDSILDATAQNQVGTQLGTFSWAADGTVAFSVVPEPSTYVMCALGGTLLGGLMFLRRRRAIRA
jgi:PEP-CTERM motif